MKKVLITGVAGFLGSHLADEFLRRKYDVIGVDNLIGGYKENIPTGVKFHDLDLGDFDNVNELFNGVDTVIHTACTAYEGLSVFSPAFITRNTSHITTVAVSASIKHGVKKFVNMSSMARYGSQDRVPFQESMTPKPQDPYGIAKYASELMIKNLCQTHGMEFVILVPHNIIGPRQKYNDPYRNVASIMINRILQGKQPVIYGDGSQKRVFSFIEDVVSPLMVACESDIANGMTINIGPDEEFISILELGEIISRLMGAEFSPIFMPERPQEVKEASCSADLARKVLGYKTSTTLEEGLASLIKWISLQGPKDFSYHLPIEIINSNTPQTWVKKLI